MTVINSFSVKSLRLEYRAFTRDGTVGASTWYIIFPNARRNTVSCSCDRLGKNPYIVKEEGGNNESGVNKSRKKLR